MSLKFWSVFVGCFFSIERSWTFGATGKSHKASFIYRPSDRFEDVLANRKYVSHNITHIQSLVNILHAWWTFQVWEFELLMVDARCAAYISGTFGNNNMNVFYSLIPPPPTSPPCENASPSKVASRPARRASINFILLKLCANRSTFLPTNKLIEKRIYFKKSSWTYLSLNVLFQKLSFWIYLTACNNFVHGSCSVLTNWHLRLFSNFAKRCSSILSNCVNHDFLINSNQLWQSYQIWPVVSTMINFVNSKQSEPDQFCQLCPILSTLINFVNFYQFCQPWSILSTLSNCVNRRHTAATGKTQPPFLKHLQISLML